MLTNINYFNKNSVSPTNIYFAKYNGTKNVVMKVHFDVRDHEDVEIEEFYKEVVALDNSRRTDGSVNQINIAKLDNVYRDYKIDIDGLEYEINVFEEIVSKQASTPNFLGFVEKKQFEILDFINLTRSFPLDLTYSIDRIYLNSELESFLSLLPKSVYSFTFKGLEKQLAIKWIEIFPILSKYFTIHCLITEEPVNTLSLQDVIEDNLYTEYDLICIFFQLIYTLMYMEQIQLQHNDLHFQNILIERPKAKQMLLYEVDGVVYRLNTNYIVKIFDWDLAYSPPLKINYKLKLDMYRKNGILNKFVKGFDLFTILCYLNKLCLKGGNSSVNSLCTKEIIAKLLPKAIGNNSLKVGFNSIKNMGENFIDANGFDCRANIHKNLEMYFDKVEDIIKNPMFDILKCSPTDTGCVASRSYFSGLNPSMQIYRL